MSARDAMQGQFLIAARLVTDPPEDVPFGWTFLGVAESVTRADLPDAIEVEAARLAVAAERERIRTAVEDVRLHRGSELEDVGKVWSAVLDILGDAT